MLRARRLLAAALALTCTTALVACGDDGGDDAVPVAAADDTSSTTAEDAHHDDDHPDLLSGECGDFYRSFIEASKDIGAPGNGKGNGKKGAAELDQLADFFDQAVDDVPAAIHDDFAAIADAYGTMVRAIAEHGIDLDDPAAAIDPDTISELQALAAQFDAVDIQAASDRVNRYLSEHCTG